MGRATLPWLATAVLAAGVPSIRADGAADALDGSKSTPFRDAFVDGSIDMDSISEERVEVLEGWARTKTARLRRRADARFERAVQRGEDPEALPERKPLDEMTNEEVAAELRELTGVELAVAQGEADDAEMAVADLESDPDATAEEIALAQAEADAAETAVEVAEEEVQVAEDVEAAVEDLPEEIEVEIPEEDVVDAPTCGTACPIPTVPTVTDMNYDPAEIDWAGLIRTIKNICGREPRFCSFCIRTAFHDSGSFAGDGADGADASIILDDIETMLEDSTNTGFVPYARAILAYIGEFYGTSAADLLAICGAYGPAGLSVPGHDAGEFIDPAHDNLEFAHLTMGRVDHDRSASLEAIRAMHDKLPGEFAATPELITFFVDALNEHVVTPQGVEDDKMWRLHERDIIALLGSHTLMDNRGCQQQTCDGERTMFLWSTDWYKDMISGTCQPRKAPPLGDDKLPSSYEGAKGRNPDAAERREMRECSFKSAAGLELADNLQCQVDELRGGTPEDENIMAGASHRFVDWFPEASTRGECCGATCEPCTAGSTDWWCEGAEEGTAFWPYPWADCELAFAIKETQNNPEGYCPGREGVRYAHEVDCGDMDYSDSLLDLWAFAPESERMAEDGPLLEFFARDEVEWTHYFNKGMNKLAALGATWGNNPTILHDLPTIACDGFALCEGEPMPVPADACAPIRALFGEGE